MISSFVIEPSRTFEGYDLVEEKLPSNSKGTMKVDPVEVTYYYIYKSKVTAEYIDKTTGNRLTEDEIQDGHEGDNYTISLPFSSFVTVTVILPSLFAGNVSIL